MYLLEFLHYAAILFTVLLLEGPESLSVRSITQDTVILSYGSYLQLLRLKSELFVGDDRVGVNGTGM